MQTWMHAVNHDPRVALCAGAATGLPAHGRRCQGRGRALAQRGRNQSFHDLHHDQGIMTIISRDTSRRP
jgi:hypothetical protein